MVQSEETSIMQIYKQLLQTEKDKIIDSLLKLPEGAQP